MIKITELVDRDIAANSKPISIVAIAIPWLPFVLFVEGAPMDSHPVLAGLALGISLAWLAFVMWRVVRYTTNELEPYRKSLGPMRFWTLMAGTFLAIGVIAAVLTWLD